MSEIRGFVARCPECGGTKVETLSSTTKTHAFYRCVGECRSWRTAGEREFRVAWSTIRKVDAARDRAVARAIRWLDDYGTRPVTQALRALRPSPETRAAWKAVRRAKTRPALIRRAQVWLDLLRRDAQDIPGGMDFRGPYPTRYEVVGRGSRAVVKSSTSVHWIGTPEIVFSDHPTARGDRLRGEYTRSFLAGVHRIYLADDADLDELRRTLLHEAQHFLDYAVELPDRGGHDRRWDARLGKLTRLFPAEGLR